MFLQKTNTPIGLDISDLSLKALELRKQGDKIKIQAIGRAYLQKGIVDNGEIKQKSEFLKYVKKILSEPLFGKFTSTDIVASLPESRTFIKFIQLANSEDIKGSLVSELEKNIPVDLSELYCDWQVIDKANNIISVLVGAAPKSIVDQYKSYFDEINLSLVALEIEPVAIARCILTEENPKNKQPRIKNYGILDIGAKRTSLTIYSKNTILFSLSLPISGNGITETIANQLEISPEQAEKAKLICGLDELKAQGVIKTILTDMIKVLSQKILEAINYNNMHFSERGPISRIYLSGGGANIKNLDKILTENLLIETLRSDPLINLNEDHGKLSHIFNEDIIINPPDKKLNNIKIDGSVNQSNELTYSTAIGLALREIFLN
jgi:type IV pilus assembly protein PilM